MSAKEAAESKASRLETELAEAKSPQWLVAQSALQNQ
jgi:hypothetical protein